MTIRPLCLPIFCSALLVFAAAQAQTAPPITDTGPPPAEDRASTGAVVLEKAPVLAQRDKALSDVSNTAVPAATAGSVGRIGGTPIRPLTRAESRRVRATEAAELRRRGAGSLTTK